MLDHAGFKKRKENLKKFAKFWGNESLNLQEFFAHIIFFSLGNYNRKKTNVNSTLTKILQFNPWAQIFGTHSITPELFQNANLNKNHKKNQQYFLSFRKNGHLKSQKLPKFDNLQKFQRFFDHNFFQWPLTASTLLQSLSWVCFTWYKLFLGSFS